MGLFDGLKRNLNIGGVKVHNFDGPNVCSMNDAAATLRFTLVGGNADAHVNKITLELRRERRDSSNARQLKVMRNAVFDNGGAGWDIAADASHAFEFDLPLNAATQIRNADVATSIADKRPDLSGDQAAMAGAVMNGLGRFLQAAERADEMAHPDDRWTFKVIVDVSQVALDPAAEIPTNLLAPGAFGLGARFGR